MPYDPSADELRRLRREFDELRRAHDREVWDRKMNAPLHFLWIVIGAIWIVLALVWVYKDLRASCGCG